MIKIPNFVIFVSFVVNTSFLLWLPLRHHEIFAVSNRVSINS